MSFELVHDDEHGKKTYIDNNFRLVVTHMNRININTAIIEAHTGNVINPVAVWDEYRLWDGALFVGKFDSMDEVSKVVSQIRTNQMERRRK